MNTHTHTHTLTHGHVDGTALGPDRDCDSCVIISSTPPFSNKLPLLFSLFSPPVKLLISAATRGDDKSLRRDERSSAKTPHTLPLADFHTHTHTHTHTRTHPLSLTHRDRQTAIFCPFYFCFAFAPQVLMPIPHSPITRASPQKLPPLKKRKEKTLSVLFIQSGNTPIQNDLK